MAKWISSATCAAAALAMTLAAAQPAAPQARSKSSQTSKGRAPAQSAAADATKAPQEATLTGCVVREAANGGQATIVSNGISYKLTGRRDSEFAQYLGKRVEVTGLLDTASTGPRATSGKADAGGSVPPKDLTATGGQSDVTATGTPRDNTVPPSANTTLPAGELPLATDRGTTADLTGRMQVKTLRVVVPNCL